VNISRLEVLAEYGYGKDPFNGVMVETGDSAKLRRVLGMAVKSQAMVAVVARWGFGKTTALKMALEDVNAHIVHLHTPDKERVVVSDIEKGIILSLSNESCKRTKELRAIQIRRILGEAARERPVVLVIEEAHRMHPSTLRALKTFRELEWMGRSPLFTTVLVGQTNPLNKRHVDEVRLRSSVVQMRGIAPSEAAEYIHHTVGRHFDTDAVEAFSALPEARNFLEMQEALVALMERALTEGRKRVTGMDVFEVYGGGLKELIKATGRTLTEIAAEAGVPRVAASMVVNNKPGSLTQETVTAHREALGAVLRKYQGNKGKSQPKLKAVIGGGE
jgi:type II secretory pathway predicted ATPase ExeA